MNKKVSIVIRCLNENNNLKYLIPKILQQNYKDYEIIFVDSGSTDGTIDTINRFIYTNDNFNLYHIKKSEFTFGKSLNIGFQKSKGDIVISLSAHCFPTNNSWLQSILDPFATANIGIVFGSQSPHPKTRHSEASVQNTWFNGSSRTTDDAFLNNGNAAYRRVIWEKFKFDEQLTGLEDIDMGIKSIDAGWKIFYSAEAEVQHFHEENYRTIQNRYRRESEAMKNLNSLNSSSNTIIKNTFFHCLKGFFRGVKYDLKTSSKSEQPNKDFFSIFMYRLNQYLGTYKGYKNNMSKNKITDLYFYPPKP